MNRPETRFWRNELREPLRALGHASRVESHATSIGIPDVNFKMHDSPEWWLELKVTHGDREVAVRPAQWMWLEARRKANGHVAFLLQWTSDNLPPVYLLSSMVEIGETDPYEWRKTADEVWIGRMNWQAFIQRIHKGAKYHE